MSYDDKSCNALQKPYYSPVEAALRWCGLIGQESKILAACANNPTVVPVNAFPQWPCLRANAEKIFDALINGEMPKGRDGRNVPNDEHVAPARVTVRHTDLKAWMAKHYPDQKPPFLFDEIERNTHATINADSFRALQADRDNLKTRLEKAVEVYRAQKEEIDLISRERDSLLAAMESMNAKIQATAASETPLAKRTENGLHATVAALAQLYTKTDCSKPYEASETIVRELERRGINAVKKDTLASYIKVGNERLAG